MRVCVCVCARLGACLRLCVRVSVCCGWCVFCVLVETSTTCSCICAGRGTMSRWSLPCMFAKLGSEGAHQGHQGQAALPGAGGRQGRELCFVFGCFWRPCHSSTRDPGSRAGGTPEASAGHLAAAGRASCRKGFQGRRPFTSTSPNDTLWVWTRISRWRKKAEKPVLFKSLRHWFLTGPMFPT